MINHQPDLKSSPAVTVAALAAIMINTIMIMMTVNHLHCDDRDSRRQCATHHGRPGAVTAPRVAVPDVLVAA